MMEKKYRYPGVQPFKTSDKDIFFGRNEDRDKLYNLIQLEKLVVLFGKSGYGKSSLLNAGIMPLLTDTAKGEKFRFTPIEVRLGNYAVGTSLSPLQTLKVKLDEKVADTEGWSFLDKTTEKETLWAHFKRKQSQLTQRFVLIFDQFEEFFSYPAEQQEAFRWQLADVLFTDIPQSLRDKVDELTDDAFNRLSNPMNIKIVFSIRADRMSLMDGLKDALPTILHKRYELRSLSPTQAQEAIESPANILDASFSTPPFEYTKDAITRILKELTSEQTKGVEAFQLQIVCEEIEKTVEKGGIPDRDNNGLPDVDVENLPDFKNLYENYYRRKLTELTPSVQTAAQRVLEDGLLAEDAATGEGRRMSVDSRALLGQFSSMGLTEKVLIDLEKTYLIRREVNTVGGFSFEISHDTLVAPIQKAKKERKEIEEKERLEREQIEKEKQLAEAKRQAEIEEQKRKEAEHLRQEADLQRQEAEKQKKEAEQQRQIAVKEREYADLQTQRVKKQQHRSNIFATLAFICAIGAIGLAIFANNKTNDAVKAKNEATDALNKFKKAQFEIDLSLAKGQLSGGNSCLSDEIFESLQKALIEFKNETDMKTQMEDLNKDIQKNNADCPIIKIQ